MIYADLLLQRLHGSIGGFHFFFNCSKSSFMKSARIGNSSFDLFKSVLSLVASLFQQPVQQLVLNAVSVSFPYHPTLKLLGREHFWDDQSMP